MFFFSKNVLSYRSSLFNNLINVEMGMIFILLTVPKHYKAMSWVGLQYVIGVFPDHSHLL